MQEPKNQMLGTMQLSVNVDDGCIIWNILWRKFKGSTKLGDKALCHLLHLIPYVKL